MTRSEGDLRNDMGHIIEVCAPDPITGTHDRERQLWIVEQIARTALSSRHEYIPYPGSQRTDKEQTSADDEYVKLSVGMAEAINHTLREFGDEYEGRLAPAREAVEAFEAFLMRDDTPRSETAAKHYSGDTSTAFWARVNALPREGAWLRLYDRGVELQNLEEAVLSELTAAEETSGGKTR